MSDGDHSEADMRAEFPDMYESCAYCAAISMSLCTRCEGCPQCCDCDDGDEHDDPCEECDEFDCICPPNQCPECGDRCATLCIDDTCRRGPCCCFHEVRK